VTTPSNIYQPGFEGVTYTAELEMYQAVNPASRGQNTRRRSILPTGNELMVDEEIMKTMRESYIRIGER